MFNIFNFRNRINLILHRILATFAARKKKKKKGRQRRAERKRKIYDCNKRWQSYVPSLLLLSRYFWHYMLTTQIHIHLPSIKRNQNFTRWNHWTGRVEENFLTLILVVVSGRSVKLSTLSFSCVRHWKFSKNYSKRERKRVKDKR